MTKLTDAADKLIALLDPYTGLPSNVRLALIDLVSANEKAKHDPTISLVISVLQECEEYFDNRADADCDQDGFIPNAEMRLLNDVREVLRKAGAS